MEADILSGKERVLALGTFAALAALLLCGAVWMNDWQQRTSVERDARRLSEAFAARIGEIDTMMTSLIGMHHASSDFEAGQLATLSERLHEQYPFLSGIGRYASVPAEARAGFESGMADDGYYAFSIRDVDVEGKRVPSPPRPEHLPITLVEPLSPANLRMVGIDLASLTGLGAPLSRLAANGHSLLARLPSNWHFDNDLVLFRSAYFGRQPPRDERGRIEQADGGYWISVDGERLIDSLSTTSTRFDIEVVATVDNLSSPIAVRGASGRRALWLERLHEPSVVLSDWNVGESRVSLRLSQPIGMPSRNAAIVLAAFVLLFCLCGLAVGLLHHRRRSIRWRTRSADLLNAERIKAKKTLDSIGEAVVSLDAERRVAQLNPAAERLLGRGREAIVGQPFESLISLHRADDDSPFELGAELLEMAPNERRERDVHPGGTDGEETILTLAITETGSRDDEAGTEHIIVLRDVSRERRLTRELEHLANHDSLTGCTNRYFFERRLGELMADRVHSHRSHALCYIDLDQFKVVNDTCGHAAGDRLLQELTRALRALVRKSDVLSRLGGDEFGVIVVDVTAEQARQVAESVFAFFQSYLFQHEDKAFAVRASIGLVHVEETDGTIDGLMSASDIACYAAKDGGRNGLRVYTADDAALAERSSELAWLPRLRRALEHDEFRLHLQAVAAIGPATPTGLVTHFEFLLRLDDEEGQPMSPWQVIQAAERYDLMREVDRWVIRHAFDTIVAQANGPGARCTYSINLSGQSAADATLEGYIAEQIERSGVDPRSLWFELTETAAIAHFSTARDLIAHLRGLGARFALDDFGSGLSSFGYLKNLPIDVIKIDGQFVRNIVEDPADREMVRAIHQVGRAMGVETVAEFVESAAILRELVGIGIDYAQGYHIGRPCPAEVAMSRLAGGDEGDDERHAA